MRIRVRLPLWYSAIFALALLVFGSALYLLMAQHLDRMLRDTMSDRASHLVSAVGAVNRDVAPGTSAIIPPLDNFGASSVHVQVLGCGGTVLDRSANLEGRSLPVPRELAGQPDFTASFDGGDMRVTLTPASVPGQGGIWVQVAATYEQRDMVLNRLLWVLVGGGLGTVAVVGLLSSLLARHPVPCEEAEIPGSG